MNVQQLSRCVVRRRLISIRGASLILSGLLLSGGLPVIVYASDGISLQRQTLDHPEPQAGANFGTVFRVGDLNGDGTDEFVVSAINQDVGENIDQGQVYVYLSSP